MRKDIAEAILKEQCLFSMIYKTVYLSFHEYTRRLSQFNNHFPSLHCFKFLFTKYTSQVRVSILYH